MRVPAAPGAFVCISVAALMMSGCGSESRSPAAESGLDVTAALGAGSDTAAFARALGPRAFAFPADHGPHEGFRTEWWYLTGTLFDAERRAFGFQLTFFRNALAPTPVEGSTSTAPQRSAWRSNHVWMAHFAISDDRGQRFRFAERFAREALDLAGAAPGGLAVHLQDWRLGEDRIVARQRLATGELSLDLAFDAFQATRPPVLQGDAGLSAKGPEPGNASYYYSMPRLATRGVLTLDGELFEVEGRAWLDREWSTSALGADLEGWDWFALQLDDGRDLMFYRRTGACEFLRKDWICDCRRGCAIRSCGSRCGIGKGRYGSRTRTENRAGRASSR
jgi:predicted secreted hydrolase